MISYEILSGLFLTALVLALVPGPDNLFVLTQSMLHGRWAGLVVTLGFSTGLIVHTLGVTLGTAALIQASPLAFTLLKLCGACYLIYLAWRFLQATTIKGQQLASEFPRAWRLYRRGIVMNVTNPKVSLFFLAFLPQFADPRIGPVFWQMITFGLIFILATLLVFGGLALLAAQLSPWLMQRSQVQRWIHRFAALIFVVLAIRLVWMPMGLSEY